MKDIDIIYNILQYGAVQDTIECIESIIEKTLGCTFHIIVVDNCSPDDSVSVLEEKYTDSENITIIKSQKNLGFACGNNLGINFARKEFNFKYLIALNNDIKMLNLGLYDTLENEYQNSSFAVLGPMIYTADGRYISNPVRLKPLTKKQLKKRIVREKILLNLHTYDYFGILDFLRRFRIFLKPKESKNFEYCLHRLENVQLHGSFLVFSKKYFDYFDGFDSSTYMYMEEYFLYKHLSENNLKSVYFPKIQVYHKEDASTDQVLKSSRRKEIFIHKNSLDSANKLLNLYEYYQEKGEE